jgi:hypothetical protein
MATRQKQGSVVWRPVPSLDSMRCSAASATKATQISPEPTTAIAMPDAGGYIDAPQLRRGVSVKINQIWPASLSGRKVGGTEPLCC